MTYAGQLGDGERADACRGEGNPRIGARLRAEEGSAAFYQVVRAPLPKQVFSVPCTW
ncbi:hypothetical protein AB0J90_27565 [Micromonospora sp. NPDC049523]|uniref:hypothetical protein n=1 Tax=Micromonospora sp. NPDC049523 TaxID=3155921 RepID=UPI00342346F9